MYRVFILKDYDYNILGVLNNVFFKKKKIGSVSSWGTKVWPRGTLGIDFPVHY